MKKSLFSILALTSITLLAGCSNVLPTTSSSVSSTSSSTSSISSSSTSSSILTSTSTSTPSSSSSTSSLPDGNTITIAKAIEIGLKAGEDPTTERYLIKATIVSIDNPTYGQMTLKDDTGTISVYGTYDADGNLRYSELENKPYAGDIVIVSVTLHSFNGTAEIKNARLISFEHVDPVIDPSEYEEMKISAVREVELEHLVKTTGVVARITYATGLIPNGFYIVDETGSIYVYDSQIAARVSIGNTVTIAGKKDSWILEGEKSNAEKFGYKGSCQISSATLIENDEGNTDFDKSWISEITVKELVNTPVTENISNKIFKTYAQVKKVDGKGFVNYYINDLDGKTGSYSYTQASGSDYKWLNEFDGKICTVYLTAINAKSTTTACYWRFVPIQVVDEGYTFDQAKAQEFAYEYYVKDIFKDTYTGDPLLNVPTSISNDLIDLSKVSISYKSNDENVINFAEEDGQTVMHAKNNGTAEITVTLNNEGYTPVEKKITIKVDAPKVISALTVDEAFNSPVDAENKITVRGIAGPSLINQSGFYLVDDTGIIAVTMDAEVLNTISFGNEVIIEGYRVQKISKENTTVQSCIQSATIVANLYGRHDYSTASFDKSKTFADLLKITTETNVTNKAFVVTGVIKFVETKFYSNAYLTINGAADKDVSALFYCSNANSQYKMLKEYDGQEVTVEVALCDWNNKGYRLCLLSITGQDGVQKINTYNYND